MKKLLMLLAVVFTSSMFAQKQVSMHMYVKVLPEHQEEFERLEIDYWSKVAKKEIDAGRMTGWGLMKSIGVDKAATEANYLIVNTFENIEQAFSGNQKWDTSFLNLTPQDISTEGIREIISIDFIKMKKVLMAIKQILQSLIMEGLQIFLHLLVRINHYGKEFIWPIKNQLN